MSTPTLRSFWSKTHWQESTEKRGVNCDYCGLFNLKAETHNRNIRPRGTFCFLYITMDGTVYLSMKSTRLDVGDPASALLEMLDPEVSWITSMFI